MDNRSNSRANTCAVCIRYRPCGNNNTPIPAGRLGASFKFLPYQLSMVVYWTTMAVTGNGELGFDSGEGA